MGGGSMPSNTTSTQKIELSPEQKQIFQLAYPKIKNWGENASNFEPYQGSTYAGPNDLQKQAQVDYLRANEGNKKFIADGTATNQWLQKAPLDINNNPYFRGAVDASLRPYQQEFTQSVLPGIKSSGVSAGGLGSSRQGIAEGLASQSYAQKTGDIVAQMGSDAYKTGLGVSLAANQIAPTYAGLQYLPAQVKEAVGGQQQAWDQQAINDKVNQFYLQQQYPLNMAAQLLGLATGQMPGGTSVATSGLGGGMSNGGKAITTAGGALSGAVGGAAVGSALAGTGAAAGGAAAAGAGGAAAGAATGAAAGSVVPVVGTIIGALIGAGAAYASTR